MSKILSLFTLLTLFALNLVACSARSSVTEQEQQQTTRVEQYSTDNGGQQKQCNRTVVIQNNGKTETHRSSKC